MRRAGPIAAFVMVLGAVGWLALRTGRAPSRPREPADVAVRPLLPPAPGVTIHGEVAWRGPPPPDEPPLRRGVDPFCARTRGDDRPVIVTQRFTLANVVVRVVGAPATAPPPGRVTLTQDGCSYRPRVAVVVAGQPLAIVNRDGTLHNVHGFAGPRTLFNRAQPAGSPAIEQTFGDDAALVRLGCDVHPWMTGFVWVQPNGLAAVTDDDGRFTLTDVPPGRWTLEAWHERYGVRRVTIDVPDGGAAGPIRLEYML